MAAGEGVHLWTNATDRTNREDDMARLLPNGAIVSDSGSWCWNGLHWEALITSPPDKAPGAFSKERLVDGPSLIRESHASIARLRAACDELKGAIGESGSLAEAEKKMLASAPAAVQVTAATESGKMLPLHITPLELIGGSPDFKSGSKVFLRMDNRQLEFESGFKKVHYPLAYITARSETQMEIEKRVTATRLLAVGVFALAWKKSKKRMESYLTITSEDPARPAQMVFDTDAAQRLATAIAAASAPLRAQVADLEGTPLPRRGPHPRRPRTCLRS